MTTEYPRPQKVASRPPSGAPGRPLRLGWAFGTIALLAVGSSGAGGEAPDLRTALGATDGGPTLVEHFDAAGLDGHLADDAPWIVLVPPVEDLQVALAGRDVAARRDVLRGLLLRPAAAPLRAGTVLATAGGGALVLDGPADAVRLGGARIAAEPVAAAGGGIVPVDRMPLLEDGLLDGLDADRVEVLFPFGGDDAVAAWYPVHDTVMGGRSSGGVASPAEGRMRFSGRLSRENNGGFASTRARVERDRLRGATHLRFRVRGDVRKWEVYLRTDGRRDTPSWRATVGPVGPEWSVVTVAFADLVPTWRGRDLRRREPLDPADVVSVGLLLKDGPEGPFSLEVDWVAAVRPPAATAAGATE